MTPITMEKAELANKTKITPESNRHISDCLDELAIRLSEKVVSLNLEVAKEYINATYNTFLSGIERLEYPHANQDSKGTRMPLTENTAIGRALLNTIYSKAENHLLDSGKKINFSDSSLN